MKTRVICLAFALATMLPADEVRPGESLDRVRAVLGIPNGEVQLGDRVLLYYDRGSVELQEGRVTKVALRSEDEHALLLARETRLRAEREEQRARLLAEGTALKDRKLADGSFQSAPISQQIAFWEDFARRYPGVSVAEPLSIARLRLNERIAEQRRRDEELRRLDEIERRLAAAESEPVHYRVRTFPTYYGHRPHYREFGLGPITYTFYDAPLPAYVTPTTPVITPLVGDPAQPFRREYSPFRGEPGRQNLREDRWRGFDRKYEHRRDRT
jgi:hypothetical protein